MWSGHRTNRADQRERVDQDDGERGRWAVEEHMARERERERERLVGVTFSPTAGERLTRDLADGH